MSKPLRFRRRRKRKVPLLKAEQLDRLQWELVRERSAAANGQVDALIRKTSADDLPELVENPLLRTYGAVEYLGKIFADLLANDPQKAKAVAELEISLAENLPRGVYHKTTIAQGLCYAWRDLGMALRTVGHLDRSLEAFHNAKRELLPYGALTHDAAIVALSEAMTLQELHRFDEARAVIADSRRVFLRHKDMKRLVLAAVAEGVLLQRLGNYREAREVYLLLLNTVQNMEATVLASIHRVIGLCSIELGDYADAELNVTRSISLNRQLAQDVEVVRGRAVLGRLMIRRGDTDPGITYLRPVRREFLKHGLIEEAGLCGLEIVEGMLALGNHSAAETLSRRILGEFMKAGLNERAITALGYLQEAIASARASTGLVVQVREYIVSLRTVPERDFGLATRRGS